MGIYDSVIVNCPACSTRLEFQSTSSDSFLRRFTLWNVPVHVAVGTGVETCSKCNRQWKLELPPITPILREVADPLVHLDDE